jgi:hypothetical protein
MINDGLARTRVPGMPAGGAPESAKLSDRIGMAADMMRPW